MFATVSRFCFNTVRSRFPQSSVWRLLLHLSTTESSECGESVLEDRLHVERTSSMTAELFTTVRQQDVSTNVCLNSTKICQGFVRISTKLECDLKLPLWMCWIHSCSENSLAPMSANAFNNTGLIESQCTAASVCRSS